MEVIIKCYNQFVVVFLSWKLRYRDLPSCFDDFNLYDDDPLRSKEIRYTGADACHVAESPWTAMIVLSVLILANYYEEDLDD